MVAGSLDLEQRLARVRVLATDVDGVLTDGGMYYSEQGDELKKFNTRDGKGIELLRAAGLKVVIITSEKTALVSRRAEKLKVDALYQGILDKAAVIEELERRYEVSRAEMAYIGDDINDLPALTLVGVAVTVADGQVANKEVAHIVTQAKGGEGAVRELAMRILAARESEAGKGKQAA